MNRYVIKSGRLFYYSGSGVSWLDWRKPESEYNTYATRQRAEGLLKRLQKSRRWAGVSLRVGTVRVKP